MIDAKEMRRVRCMQTEEAMLERIDEKLDDAKRSGHMSHTDVQCVKDMWKAIWYAKQCCKEA